VGVLVGAVVASAIGSLVALPGTFVVGCGVAAASFDSGGAGSSVSCGAGGCDVGLPNINLWKASRSAGVTTFVFTISSVATPFVFVVDTGLDGLGVFISSSTGSMDL
jgi:hypothetical protein